MIYLFDLHYFDISNIVLFIIVVGIILFVAFVGKCTVINDETPSYLLMVRCICVFLIVVLGIVNFISLGQKAYAVNVYKNNECGVIEGEIEHLEYIYANNSTQIIGLKFSIKDKHFKINNGILNIGYSINDNIINQDGEKFKIYYLNTEKNFIDTILRIDQ